MKSRGRHLWLLPSLSNLSISFIPDKGSFTFGKLETSVVLQPELGIIKAWAARCEQMACRVRRVTSPPPLIVGTGSNYQGCFPGVGMGAGWGELGLLACRAHTGCPGWLIQLAMCFQLQTTLLQSFLWSLGLGRNCKGEHSPLNGLQIWVVSQLQPFTPARMLMYISRPPHGTGDRVKERSDVLECWNFKKCHQSTET